MTPEGPSLTFGRSARIRRRRDFDRVFARRCMQEAGPLLVHGARNDGQGSRLGLAVGRKVGSAPVRNAIKRRLREAFRSIRAQLPSDLDLVIVVRPHAQRSPDEYGRMLQQTAAALHDRLGD